MASPQAAKNISFWSLRGTALMDERQFKEFEAKLLEKRRRIVDNPLKSLERGLLDLIDTALERIRGGKFGECLHYGQEIGSKRLAAIPWTRYCITCQELIDQFGR